MRQPYLDLEKPMNRIWMVALALALGAATGVAKPKIKPCVTFATSWEAAIEEAKLLSAPIVVHRHGWT